MKASIYSDVWRGGDADAPVVDRVTYCNVTAMAQDALLAVLKKHPCES